jgi:hypothetical protein
MLRTSIARMVLPPLALVAMVGEAREPPEARTVTAAQVGETVGAAALAIPHRSADTGDAFMPVFDIVRVEPAGDAVIAGRAAPAATVELLRNGEFYDRAIADHSGQFVMVPPRLLPGDNELTLRSRQPDGNQATSKQIAVVVLQPTLKDRTVVVAPMTLDVVLSKPEAHPAGGGKGGSVGAMSR